MDDLDAVTLYWTGAPGTPSMSPPGMVGPALGPAFPFNQLSTVGERKFAPSAEGSDFRPLFAAQDRTPNPTRGSREDYTDEEQRIRRLLSEGPRTVDPPASAALLHSRLGVPQNQ
eukprot:gene6396-6181_t